MNENIAGKIEVIAEFKNRELVHQNLSDGIPESTPGATVEGSEASVPIASGWQRDIFPAGARGNRTSPLLEIICLILFCSAPSPLSHLCLPTAILMCVGVFYARLPVSAAIALYGVLVLAIGLLRRSRGIQYLASVTYGLLLAGSVLTAWAPILLDGPVDWSGLVRDRWIMGTIFPLTVALVSCMAMRVFAMITLSRSEWQFTLRDGLLFVAATGIFLGVVTPLTDWS